MKSAAVLAVLAAVVVGVVGCGAAESRDGAGGIGIAEDPDTEKSATDPSGAKPPQTLAADASVPGTDGTDGGAGDGASCGSLASYTQFRCSSDGASRGKCISGSPDVETCARGCLRGPTTSDDVCMGTSTTWSCTGSYGTKKASNGDYYVTAFGCWKDAAGASHGDSGDNCVPSCLAQAKSEGLCLPGDTGKQCEERVTWYTADAARFGCLARVKITNPANGKSVVAVALDLGPSCSVVESKVQKAVLDASGRVDRQLFGADQGVLDRALVHVVEVDKSTPLGAVTP